MSNKIENVETSNKYFKKYKKISIFSKKLNIRNSNTFFVLKKTHHNDEKLKVCVKQIEHPDYNHSMSAMGHP